MNSNSPGIEVLAATAWTKGPGSMPARIVLCRMIDDVQLVKGDGFQYITWIEIEHTATARLEKQGSSLGFNSGDYTYDRMEAWESFTSRAKRHLAVEWSDAEMHIETNLNARTTTILGPQVRR